MVIHVPSVRVGRERAGTPFPFFLVNVRYMLSPVRLSVVCLTVCRLSVTLVHSNQAVEIFGNISMAFGTLAIR